MAVKAEPGFALPDIVVQHDAKARTGFDWKAALARQVAVNKEYKEE